MNISELDLARIAKARRALERMPSRTLRVFVASQVGRLSFAESARREHMALWQVKRHMRRAIRIIAREQCRTAMDWIMHRAHERCQ